MSLIPRFPNSTPRHPRVLGAEEELWGRPGTVQASRKTATLNIWSDTQGLSLREFTVSTLDRMTFFPQPRYLCEAGVSALVVIKTNYHGNVKLPGKWGWQQRSICFQGLRTHAGPTGSCIPFLSHMVIEEVKKKFFLSI